MCVHVDVNTAFYHALNTSLANYSSRFYWFIWQRWFVIVEWSTVSLPSMSALLKKHQNWELPLIRSIVFMSLAVFHFSLISSQQNTPPSSLCWPFLQEISLSKDLFISWHNFLRSYCVWVFLVLIAALPPSFLLCPKINTGSDFSLCVYIVFLQLYQERCVNGCVAGWVVELEF